ncbi:hypothetical protein [Tomitella gaofuii]|uniref:hypothetical protein n=1 Tax=Tomitella gaofuii TaxID=2760083 RepID=UPI0015F7E8EA|nr:hypothetical protein [Tomitella gaofuii]
MTPADPAPDRRTAAAIAGRRADTTRRRDRVLAALSQAHAAGREISVAGIATSAGVDRTFLYRHRDLLAQVRAEQARPDSQPAQPTVSRASLQADLLAAHERATRLTSHIQRLERRLSEALGERLWQETGLGAPQDVDELQQRIVQLEQQTLDLRLQLAERDQDLAANRELMTRLNTTT